MSSSPSVSFVKLHTSILTSTVWGLTAPTRVVWVTLLLLADRSGTVNCTRSGLARIAAVTLSEVDDALAVLSASDPDSRDGTDGARIAKCDGGWSIVNYAAFREQRTEAQIRDARRVADKRRQDRTTPLSESVRRCPPASTAVRADADADAEAEAERTTTPPLPPKRKIAQKKKLDDRVARVLDLVDRLRVQLGLRPLAPSARTPTVILARLAEGITEDELFEALTVRATLAQSNPEEAQWLNATSPFTGPGKGPGGWAVSQRLVDRSRCRPVRIGPSLPSADDVLSRRQEEDRG